MPKTLAEKFAMLISANLNELVGPLSERPKGGTPITAESYIRRIEREIYGIDKAAHDMIDRVRVLHDRQDSYERQCRELDRAINLHLTQNNHASAVLAQKKLNRIQPQMRRTHEEAKEWESRLLVLKEKRDRLEGLLSDAKKKAEDRKKNADSTGSGADYWVVDE